MFPDMTKLELERFLFLSKGDVEHATQIILAKETHSDDEIGQDYEYGKAKPTAVQVREWSLLILGSRMEDNFAQLEN